MARLLGEGLIAIRASGKDFGVQARKIVAEGTARLKADVPLTLDARKAMLSTDALKASVHELARAAGDIRFKATDREAEATLLRLRASIDSLRKRAENISLGSAGRDRLRARIIADELALDRLKAKAEHVDIGGGKGGVSGGKLGGSALLGAGLLALPAIATLGGLAAGAGLALGGAFTAAAGAVGAFGAVAKPVLTDAQKAAAAVETAQNAHAIAVAKVTAQYQYAMSVAKTRAQRQAAYAAEQKRFDAAGIAQTAAISKAYAELSPQQITLSKQLGAMASAWQDVKAAETPVVSGALQPWLKSVTSLTKDLAPVIAKIAPVVGFLGAKFDALVNSPAFRTFRDFVGSTGAAVTSAAGSSLLDLIKAFIILLPQFDPLIREAAGAISRIGPAVLTWASSKKASQEIQSFLQWFSRNGPTVTNFIKNVAGALGNLAPGLAQGGLLELKIISDFLGLVAKLPKGIAGPLAEVAGAALILSKIPGGSKVISFVVSAAFGGLLKGAEGSTAAGLMSKLTGGLGFVVKAGVAVAAAKIALTVVASQAPKASPADQKAFDKATPGGVRKFLDFFFGSDVNTASVTAYVRKLFGPAANWGPQQVFDWLRHAVANVFDGIRHDIAHYTDIAFSHTIGSVIRFGHDVETQFDSLRHQIAVIWDGIRHEIAHVWDIIFSNTIGALIRIGHGIETRFDAARHETAVIFDGIRHEIAHVWDLVYTNTIGALTRLGGGIKNAFTTSKNWIHDNFITPVSNFFTQTLPNAFRTAVTTIGRVWTNIQGAVKGPVNWVLQNVISPLFGAIDAVTSFVGLGRPLPTGLHLARGGRVPGAGQGDTVPAMLTPGEVVIPRGMVAAGAVDHLRGRLPGFASGGLVNPIGRGLRPGRIDQGVDYSGFGALYALGSGQITGTDNAGWPGGTFIDLRLNPPYGSGSWYYAEDIQPAVRTGQGVSAGQLLGHAWNGPSGIEVGWASGSGGQTAAAAAGQQAHSGDPGSVSTAWGKAASDLIGSLGGPRGILQGAISGGTAGIGFIVRTLQDIFGGLGNMAKVAIDLAHGDAGGASRALVALIPHGAGGAKGLLGQTLLRLPGKLAGEAMSFLVSKVKGFADSQQAASGGGNIGPVSGPADKGPGQAMSYALGRLGGYGWGKDQFPPLRSLWLRESGWGRFARNPRSGAYGIPQALPPSKLPAAGQAAGGSHASPQIDWGLNYIRTTPGYGTPAAAWAHEVAHNWYGQGGLVDPLAGPARQIAEAAALRRRLARDQGHELGDYAGLRHAFLGGPHRYLTGATRAQLDGLARRQAAEELAYRRVAGAGGLTGAGLAGLGTAARLESGAAGASALTRLPGGHPGWSHGLRAWLGLLAGESGVKLPPALTGIAALFEASRGQGTFTVSAGDGTDREWAYGLGLTGQLVPSADQGTILRPGLNARWNGTGRDEHLIPAGQQPVVVLEFAPAGAGTLDEAFMRWIKQTVRTRGGSVQATFGRHEGPWATNRGSGW